MPLPCYLCPSQRITIPFLFDHEQQLFLGLSVSCEATIRTPCSQSAKLNVQVSLWTQAEVLGALRDMARGRWLRGGEKSEQFSRLFGCDQDACCVQAFTKVARFRDGGDNDPRAVAGLGNMDARILGDGNQSRRERRALPEDNGLSGPVFYRAAWRRTGEQPFVWKLTSRWVC